MTFAVFRLKRQHWSCCSAFGWQVYLFSFRIFVLADRFRIFPAFASHAAAAGCVHISSVSRVIISFHSLYVVSCCFAFCLVTTHGSTRHTLASLRPVILFSKSSKMLLGYFYPKKTVWYRKKIHFRGDLSDTSAQTATLPAAWRNHLKSIWNGVHSGKPSSSPDKTPCQHYAGHPDKCVIK